MCRNLMPYFVLMVGGVLLENARSKSGFYYDYEKVKYYEHSKRVLLPKYILHQLSKYENITFPVNIKITNESQGISKYVTVLEFLADIDHMYLSNNMFNCLQLTENDTVCFEILKEHLPTATSIKIKPHTNNFSLIEDKKLYLETNFKNLFGIIISINFIND